MSPNVHYRHRRIVWEASTGAVEFWLGLGMMVRALWLLAPRAESIPPEVVSRLLPPWSEPQWGLLLFALGFVQWFVADTRWSRLRAFTATCLWLLVSYFVAAYGVSGLWDRGVVPLTSVMALAEFWIAWRAWHDRSQAQGAPYERRSQRA